MNATDAIVIAFVLGSLLLGPLWFALGVRAGARLATQPIAVLDISAASKLNKKGGSRWGT